MEGRRERTGIHFENKFMIKKLMMYLALLVFEMAAQSFLVFQCDRIHLPLSIVQTGFAPESFSQFQAQRATIELRKKGRTHQQNTLMS